MATLSTETYTRKDGERSTTFRVLIGGGKRQRQTIRLGDVSEKIANDRSEEHTSELPVTQ